MSEVPAHLTIALEVSVPLWVARMRDWRPRMPSSRVRASVLKLWRLTVT